MSADINKAWWWLHMHTFLPGCIVACLGQPRQRLSPPTYWFIRGDLKPPCHMLPQMGTYPQALQALWQQAWIITDAKEKTEKELCQLPDNTNSVCIQTWTYIDFKAFFCFCLVWPWGPQCFCTFMYAADMCGMSPAPCRHMLLAASEYLRHAMTLGRSKQGKSVKLWMQGWREETQSAWFWQIAACRPCPLWAGSRKEPH